MELKIKLSPFCVTRFLSKKEIRKIYKFVMYEQKKNLPTEQGVVVVKINKNSSATGLIDADNICKQSKRAISDLIGYGSLEVLEKIDILLNKDFVCFISESRIKKYMNIN